MCQEGIVQACRRIERVAVYDIYLLVHIRACVAYTAMDITGNELIADGHANAKQRV